MFGVPNRRRTAANLGSLAGAIAVLLAAALAVHGQENKQDNKQATKPDESRKAAALAAWNRIVTVLQHPRCMNCHQENVPLQGDERRIHIPLVVRGHTDKESGAGLGFDAMRCSNCHNATGNNETSGTPGAINKAWSLAPSAPINMVWQGLSSHDLCDRFKAASLERFKKPPPDLIEHMQVESLVTWAWHPGGERTPIPMPHDEFVDQVRIWVNYGMICPD
jgi:hypothetical protein